MRRLHRVWSWRSLFVVVVAAVALGGSRFAHADSTQHIWLHYDYMVTPGGQSLAPDPRSIQLVVDAFAAHSIQLHIDGQHTALPYHALLNGDVPEEGCPQLGLGPADIVSFTGLRKQYFHPTANHEWHYVVFGDLSDCTGHTGVTSLDPSTDFVVTLGNLRRLGLQITPYVEGGTFMHELGHTLGLNHGGGDLQNWKSNYLSVMNYRFQYGIPYAASPGSTSIAGRKLDYSDEALPTLDETHLNEPAGLGATLPSDRTDITFWTNPGPGDFTAAGPAVGPIDWNQNGVLEPDVVADLDWPWNTLQCGENPPIIPFCAANLYFEQIQGFDDWAEVHWWLAQSQHPGPKLEHENRAAEPIVTGVSPASGPQAGGNTVVISGAHFEKATQVSFGSAAAPSVTVVNDSMLSVTAPPGTGTVDVTVLSGDNPSPSIASDQYTYLLPPVVDSVTPSSGAAATTVTVSGSNLSAATAVAFGTTPASSFTVVDDQTLTAVVPAGSGTVQVTVSGPGGTSATSPTGTFTYVPVVDSVSPTSGLAGALVTIHGSSFTGTTQVCFGGICSPSWTVVDDSTITATVPLSASAPLTVDVTVTTAGGTSAIGPGDLFTLV